MREHILKNIVAMHDRGCRALVRVNVYDGEDDTRVCYVGGLIAD